MMVKNTLRHCYVAAALACAPWPAWAQATAEEAEEIRAALQNWVDVQLAAFAGTEMTVEAGGPVSVEPGGESYRAVLPAFDVETAAGGSFTIEPIPVELAPAENGWYEASWRLPDEIAFFDRDGAESGTLTIEDQSGEGVFAPEIGGFMALQVALGGIALTSSGDDSGIVIDRLSGELAYEDVAAGVYDQPGAFMVEGVRISDPAGVPVAELGRLAVTTAATGFRMEEMTALGKSFTEAMTGIEGLPPEAARKEAALQMAELLERSFGLLSGIEVAYDLDELTVEAGGSGFSLPSGAFGFSASGLDAPTAKLAFVMDFADMAVEPAPSSADLIPTSGRLELTLADLPTEALIDGFAAILRSGAAPEAEAELAATTALTSLQAALTAGGSRLILDEVTLANALASLALEGELLADASTALGMRGTATATIANLPGLIERVQSLPEAQDALGMLIFLQGMGAPETGADGDIIHRYEVEVTPAGEVLINGVDMAGLAGGAGSP